MTKQRLLLLAGTASQAATYVRARNLSTLDVIYVSGEHHVRGLSEPPYAICGTFWDRHDAIRIWQSLLLTYPPDKRKLMRAPDEIEKFLHPVLPPIPAPTTGPCPKCGIMKPIKDVCQACIILSSTVVKEEHVIGPVDTGFKHIKEPKPVNNGFKSIRK